MACEGYEPRPATAHRASRFNLSPGAARLNRRESWCAVFYRLCRVEQRVFAKAGADQLHALRLPVLAVLAFDNQSTDPEMQFFSD
ncbi:MAG: hypothetical protein K0Q43_2002 [Ramlibacter sp.]|nr:hypothetical protein [Ramlibacter sp.]